MSKRGRGTFFAVGLGLGVGLALVFLVWAVPEFRDPTYYNRHDAAEQANKENTRHQENTNEPSWWYWTTRLVSAEDTLAQWLMAFFTVIATGVSLAAVIFVRESLDLSRKATEAAVSANKQAHDLFVAENRPWIEIKSARIEEFEDEDGRADSCLVVTIRNVGVGHALHVEIHAKHLNSIFVFGSQHAEQFSNSIAKPFRFGDSVIFAGGSDELVPANPVISEMTGCALICVIYTSTHSTDIIHKTACTVKLGGGVSIQRGSMHVT